MAECAENDGRGGPSFMDNSNFSLETLKAELLSQCPSSPGQYCELKLAPNIYVLYGGCADYPHSALASQSGVTNFPGHPSANMNDVEFPIIKQWLENWSGSRIARTPKLCVTLESAVPSATPLNLSFFGRCLLVDDDSDRSDKGSLHELEEVLEFFDFLTLSPGTGAGALGGRMIMITINEARTRFYSLQLRVFFGMKYVTSVCGTTAMKLLRPQVASWGPGMVDEMSSAKQDLHNQFKRMARGLIGDDEMEEVVRLLAAAAICLWGSETVPAARLSQLQDLLDLQLHPNSYEKIRWDEKLIELALQSEVQMISTRQALGLEFHECAISAILNGLENQAGTDPNYSKEATQVTVFDVASSAPPSFSQQRFAEPPVLPRKTAKRENLCLAPFLTYVLNICATEEVFTWRWRQHLQQGSIAPDREWMLRQIFAASNDFPHGEMLKKKDLLDDWSGDEEVCRFFKTHMDDRNPAVPLDAMLRGLDDEVDWDGFCKFYATKISEPQVQHQNRDCWKALFDTLQVKLGERVMRNSNSDATSTIAPSGNRSWEEYSRCVKKKSLDREKITFEKRMGEDPTPANTSPEARAWEHLHKISTLSIWADWAHRKQQEVLRMPANEEFEPAVAPEEECFCLCNGYDGSLRLKIAHAPPPTPSAASGNPDRLIAQLALLGCQHFVDIWRDLFPYTDVTTLAGKNSQLREFHHFVRPVGRANAYLSWDCGQVVQLTRPPAVVCQPNEDSPQRPHAGGRQQRLHTPLVQTRAAKEASEEEGLSPAQPPAHTFTSLPVSAEGASPPYQGSTQAVQSGEMQNQSVIVQAADNCGVIGADNAIRDEAKPALQRISQIVTEDAGFSGSPDGAVITPNSNARTLPNLLQSNLDQMPEVSTSDAKGINDKEELEADGWVHKECCEGFLDEALGVQDPWDGCHGEDPTELHRDVKHFCDGLPEEAQLLPSHLLHPRFPETKWVSSSRIHKLCTGINMNKANICGHVDPGCLRQGLIGDCWLMAAISALSEFSGSIHSIFQKCCPPLNNQDGPYELALFCPRNNFTATTVMVNDRVPCFRRKTGFWRPCGTSAVFHGGQMELWPMVLEKAIAKLLGGYSKLDGNRVPYAWAMMTGEMKYGVFSCSTNGDDCWAEGSFDDLVNRPQDYKCTNNSYSSERIWESLRLKDLDDKLMACTFDEDKLLHGDGLLANHSYSLIEVRLIQDPSLPLGQAHCLLWLRNPWADGHEWTGDWSDNSPAWQKYPVVKEALQQRCEKKADGLFWMSWDDFKNRACDIVFSETSFGSKYGKMVVKQQKDDESWSCVPSSEVNLPDWATAGPDLWNNLTDHDPEKLQADLLSWKDDFSDQDLHLAAHKLNSSDIQWISASRIPRLVQFNLQELPVAATAQEKAYQKRWKEAAEQSNAQCHDVHVCKYIDGDTMLASPGNCWLVAAVAALAKHWKPIKDIFALCPQTPCERKDGPYTLTLHDPRVGFKKRQIRLNDRVPCYARYGNRRAHAAGWRPCFAGALYCEMWPMLLEKGIALLLDGYQHLDGNRSHLAWAVMTGTLKYAVYFPWRENVEGVPKPPSGLRWGKGQVDLNNPDPRFRQQFSFQTRQTKEGNSMRDDKVWDSIRYGTVDGKLMVCSFRSPENIDTDQTDEPVGEPVAHLTHTIVYAKQITEEVIVQRGARKAPVPAKPLRLLCLRSPWPDVSGYEGAWSFGGKRWLSHPKVAKELTHIAEGLRAEDGVFWMEWEEFQYHVSEVTMSEATFVQEVPDTASSTKPAPPAPSAPSSAPLEAEILPGASASTGVAEEFKPLQEPIEDVKEAVAAQFKTIPSTANPFANEEPALHGMAGFEQVQQLGQTSSQHPAGNAEMLSPSRGLDDAWWLTGNVHAATNPLTSPESPQDKGRGPLPPVLQQIDVVPLQACRRGCGSPPPSTEQAGLSVQPQPLRSADSNTSGPQSNPPAQFVVHQPQSQSNVQHHSHPGMPLSAQLGEQLHNDSQMNQRYPALSGAIAQHCSQSTTGPASPGEEQAEPGEGWQRFTQEPDRYSTEEHRTQQPALALQNPGRLHVNSGSCHADAEVRSRVEPEFVTPGLHGTPPVDYGNSEQHRVNQRRSREEHPALNVRQASSDPRSRPQLSRSREEQPRRRSNASEGRRGMPIPQQHHGSQASASQRSSSGSSETESSTGSSGSSHSSDSSDSSSGSTGLPGQRSQVARDGAGNAVNSQQEIPGAGRRRSQRQSDLNDRLPEHRRRVPETGSPLPAPSGHRPAYGVHQHMHPSSQRSGPQWVPHGGHHQPDTTAAVEALAGKKVATIMFHMELTDKTNYLETHLGEEPEIMFAEAFNCYLETPGLIVRLIHRQFCGAEQRWTLWFKIEMTQPLPIRKLRAVQHAIFQINDKVSFENVSPAKKLLKEVFDTKFKIEANACITTSLYPLSRHVLPKSTLFGCVASSGVYAHANILMPLSTDAKRATLRDEATKTWCNNLQDMLTTANVSVRLMSVRRLREHSPGIQLCRVYFQVYPRGVGGANPDPKQLTNLQKTMKGLDFAVSVDSAVQHGNHGAAAAFARAPAKFSKLDCHLEIRDHRNQVSALSQVLQDHLTNRLRIVAEEFGIRSDSVAVDVWSIHSKKKSYDPRKVHQQQGEISTASESDDDDKKTNMRQKGSDMTVSFFVILRDPDQTWDNMHMLQEALWSLSRRALECGDADFTFLSGISVCASELCSSHVMGGSNQLQYSFSNSSSFTARLDVIDRNHLLEQCGASHFASLFSDALHVITGITAPQLTILDLRLSKLKQTSIETSKLLQNCKRFVVLFEVRFPTAKPTLGEMQKVYDAIWSLHSEIVRHRWATLAFFRHYTIECAAEVVLPEVARAQRSLHPTRPAPKLQAHLNIVDADPKSPYLEKVGCLADLDSDFKAALREALEIPEECVILHCIEERCSHWTDSVFVEANQDASRRREQVQTKQQQNDDIGAAESEPDGGGSAPGPTHQKPLWHRMKAMRKRLASTTSVDWKDDESVYGYTLRFEIVPSPHTRGFGAQVEQLESIAASLRKFHSLSVYREFVGSSTTQPTMRFFKNFKFDYGVQVDAMLDAPGNRQHMFASETPAGPIIFTRPLIAPTCVPSDGSDNGVTLFRTHVDIIESSEVVANGAFEFAKETTKGKVIKKHFGEALEKWFHANGSLPPVSQECGGMRIPYKKEDGSAVGSDVWFVVEAVKRKPAHTCCPKREDLVKNKRGAHAVKLEVELSAYTVECSVCCKQERVLDLYSNNARFVTLVRDKLRTFSSRAFKSEWLEQGFFQNYSFDTGVMIDSKLSYELDSHLDAGRLKDYFEYALTSSRIEAHMILAPKALPAPSRQALVQEFKTILAVAIGTSERMITDVKVSDASAGKLQVDFQVHTVTQWPAVRELESLQIKLNALNRHCSMSGRWCLDAFPGYDPVKVVINRVKPALPLDADSDGENMVISRVTMQPAGNAQQGQAHPFSDLFDLVDVYAADVTNTNENDATNVCGRDTVLKILGCFTPATNLNSMFSGARGLKAKATLLWSCLRLLYNYSEWEDHEAFMFEHLSKSDGWRWEEASGCARVITTICQTDPRNSTQPLFQVVNPTLELPETIPPIDSRVAMRSSQYVVEIGGHVQLYAVAQEICSYLQGQMNETDPLDQYLQSFELLRDLLTALDAIFRSDYHSSLVSQMKALCDKRKTRRVVFRTAAPAAQTIELKWVSGQLRFYQDQRHEPHYNALDVDIWFNANDKQYEYLPPSPLEGRSWMPIESNSLAGTDMEDELREMVFFLQGRIPGQKFWADPLRELICLGERVMTLLDGVARNPYWATHAPLLGDLFRQAIAVTLSWARASQGAAGAATGKTLLKVGSCILKFRTLMPLQSTWWLDLVKFFRELTSHSKKNVLSEAGNAYTTILDVLEPVISPPPQVQQQQRQQDAFNTITDLVDSLRACGFGD